MGAAQQSLSRANANQVIVHHLSDLNYQENTNSPDNRLLTYQRYLEGLPSDRYPDVVVITGNLTASGSKEELRAVRDMLVAGFSRWAGRLHEHVFIVPGPQDVNWQVLNEVGLDAFFKVFEPFATPYHAPMPPGRDTAGIQAENWVGYPVDTCYAPEELDVALKAHFKAYTKAFGRFAKRRRKVGSKWLGMWKRPRRLGRKATQEARRQALDGLRAEFLTFTDGTRPLDLRVGRAIEAETARFKTWMEWQACNPQPNSGSAPPPLKMLITHHPLVIRANETGGSTGDLVAKRSYKPLLDAAHAAGIHLMLHGHNHNGDVVTDESIFQEPGKTRRMRQLGAASLAKTSVFNEIVAVYRETPGQLQAQTQPSGEWELAFLTVNLSAAGAVAPRGAPGNQTALAYKQIRQLTRSVTQRSNFERMLRYAMRRFSEQVYTVRQEKLLGNPPQQGISLPQEPLQLIRDVISSVIFKGLETRVRVLLKSNDPAGGPVPRLIPTYLAPAILEGPEVLLYPASVAAWSLVLGRTLIYPDGIENTVTTDGDHEWLRRSDKIKTLLPALEDLKGEATRTNALEEAARFQTLYTNLDAIKVGTNGAATIGIMGSNIYQKGPLGGPDRSYSTFICVPYPMRPIGGALPLLPEMAVLDVAVRPLELPDPEDTSPMPVFPFQPFTPERIDMLEAVTDLIGMMLTTADALGRPPGAWYQQRQWQMPRP